MKPTTQKYLQQIDDVVTAYEMLKSQAKYDDLSGGDDAAITRLLTRTNSAIERIAGPRSVYVRQAQAQTDEKFSVGTTLNLVIGVLHALRDDLASGAVDSVQELAHADVFSDFLEMASHLVDTGYKDPAAVVAGSSLEAHLRCLAQKHGVEVDDVHGKPKKADLINAELVKAGAYEKLDQKNVLAWLDLRNKAAHGEYSTYSVDQVRLLIGSVRDFIGRLPA